MALLMVCTVRFAKPAKFTDEVETGVPTLLLFGFPSLSGSASAPFWEMSVTVVLVGVVPVRVAVLVNEVVAQAGMRMVNKIAPLLPTVNVLPAASKFVLAPKPVKLAFTV